MIYNGLPIDRFQNDNYDLDTCYMNLFNCPISDNSYFSEIAANRASRHNP